VHDLRLHVDDVADEPTSTGSPSTTASRRSAVNSCASSPDSPTANGPCALTQRDDVAVDLADEHHADDLHRLGGGDAQAAAELAVDAEPVEVRGDLRDRRRARRPPARRRSAGRRRPRRTPLQRGAGHGVAAVLDDDRSAGEALQPGQRLDEGGGLGAARRGPVRAGRSCRVRAVLVHVLG
jgi:hypothetical protein